MELTLFWTARRGSDFYFILVLQVLAKKVGQIGVVIIQIQTASFRRENSIIPPGSFAGLLYAFSSAWFMGTAFLDVCRTTKSPFRNE